MNEEQKILLIKYFFDSNEIQSFLCNDLFQELKQLIPFELCYSIKNINNINRIKNKNCVFNSIKNFILKNEIYKKQLLKLYKKDINDILNKILISFVFFIIATNDTLKNIDIFKDKKSILFNNNVSIYEILT